MDTHKITQDLHEIVKHSNMHFPLIAGFLQMFKNQRNRDFTLSDLGEYGDNVPATLLNFLTPGKKL